MIDSDIANAEGEKCLLCLAMVSVITRGCMGVRAQLQILVEAKDFVH